MVWQPNAHVWCAGHQTQRSDVHQHFEVTPRSWCASVKETCATWDQHFIFLHYFWSCHQCYLLYSDNACISIVFLLTFVWIVALKLYLFSTYIQLDLILNPALNPAKIRIHVLKAITFIKCQIIFKFLMHILCLYYFCF